jgi:hypothetical protein
MPNTTFKKTIVETISVYNKRSYRATSGHMNKQAVKKFFAVVGYYGKKSKNPSPVTRERGRIGCLSTA